MAEVRARHLGPLLLLGMLSAPAIFCWFLLRRGYARSTRWAGFTLATVMTAIGVLGRIGSHAP